MGFDAATLDHAARAFRASMWDRAPEDALDECGIAERRFGPVQGNLIEVLPTEPALNTLLGVAEQGAVVDGHLEQAIDWADSFHVQYQVMVGQGRPETARAEALLNRRGFQQGRGLVRYARDATIPPDISGVPGLKVWEIGAPGDEDIAGETMVLTAAPVLGMPAAASSLLFDLPALDEWRCYTVEAEDDIVSFGSTLIRDGIAAIGLEGTKKKACGRGCHLALLRERILGAYEAGCKTIFAGVPTYGAPIFPSSARNLIRAGFVPAHRSVNWVRMR